MAADAYRLRRTGPRPSRTPAAEERGHQRAPIGEDHAKRGARGDVRGKQLQGRKRRLLVETPGLLLHMLVHAATIQDAGAGAPLLAPLKDGLPRRKLIWAQSGAKKAGFCAWGKRGGGVGGRARGTSREWPARHAGPGRGRSGWGAEPPERGRRCFPLVGWSNAPSPGLRAFRRLSKDAEVLQSREEAWIDVALIRLMLSR